MAKQNMKSAAFDMQTLFNPQGFQDIFKTWAEMNERMGSIVVETGTRTSDMMNATTKETLLNVRELTQARSEPTEYSQAYLDFIKKQAELFTRTAQTYASETQKAGSEAADLASKAGEEITGKIATTAEGMTQTVRSAANKAA